VENLPVEETKAKFAEILDQTEPGRLFPDDKEIKNMGEEHKLLIARLQENVRIRRAVTFHSDGCRYGSYVHRPYSGGVGLQACVV
jgi:translation elongation factor EF-Ts